METKRKGGGGGRGPEGERCLLEWASQIVRENEISFAAGTVSDNTPGVCLSSACVHM